MQLFPTLPSTIAILLTSLSLATSQDFSCTTSCPPTSSTINCPLTIDKIKTLNNSPTTTVYLTTATNTNTVDCDGCSSVVVRSVGGNGPVRGPFTATVTEEVTTVQGYVCLPTLLP